MLQHLESTSHWALKKESGSSIDRCLLIVLRLSGSRRKQLLKIGGKIEAWSFSEKLLKLLFYNIKNLIFLRKLFLSLISYYVQFLKKFCGLHNK